MLLTFFYLRHYPTFDQLGSQFGISESSACKVYHRYRDILVRRVHLPSWKCLLSPELEAILIDVTEQPIERPTRKQRQYYSGKKNGIP
ncbi:MAG: transposase family protein [bacterium]|nr:transposase family protein [bacterium]